MEKKVMVRKRERESIKVSRERRERVSKYQREKIGERKFPFKYFRRSISGHLVESSNLNTLSLSLFLSSLALFLLSLSFTIFNPKRKRKKGRKRERRRCDERDATKKSQKKVLPIFYLSHSDSLFPKFVPFFHLQNCLSHFSPFSPTFLSHFSFSLNFLSFLSL